MMQHGTITPGRANAIGCLIEGARCEEGYGVVSECQLVWQEVSLTSPILLSPDLQAF